MRGKAQILVIIGSTREGRFADKPARWVRDFLSEDERLDVELVDLLDWPLPFFAQPKSPDARDRRRIWASLANEWAKKIASADGFVAHGGRVQPRVHGGVEECVRLDLPGVDSKAGHVRRVRERRGRAGRRAAADGCGRAADGADQVRRALARPAVHGAQERASAGRSVALRPCRAGSRGDASGSRVVGRRAARRAAGRSNENVARALRGVTPRALERRYAVVVAWRLLSLRARSEPGAGRPPSRCSSAPFSAGDRSHRADSAAAWLGREADGAGVRRDEAFERREHPDDDRAADGRRRRVAARGAERTSDGAVTVTRRCGAALRRARRHPE